MTVEAETNTQPIILPVDLADNPVKTGQWLTVLGNLQQILQLLRPQAEESRAGRSVRLFNRMIEGLPVACLSGLPATAKLGLLRPILAEIETMDVSAHQPIAETGVFQNRLRQCRAALTAMAERQQAPDPPSQPQHGALRGQLSGQA